MQARGDGMTDAERLLSLIASAADAVATPRLALRKEEAARALGISDESFDRYIKPRVRVARFGSLRLYPVAELRRVLEDEAAPVLDELTDRRAA